MASLHVLFLDCSPQPSPELSPLAPLWQLAADGYRQQGCQLQQVRVVDLPPSELAALLAQISAANILVLGLPVVQGARSWVYQRLVEQLSQAFVEPSTGRYGLDNTVLTAIARGDGGGNAIALAQAGYEFGQLGTISPPQNTLSWCPALGRDGEPESHSSPSLHQQAQVMVSNAVALAHILTSQPLAPREAAAQARAIASTPAPPATVLTPQPISPPGRNDRDSGGIDYRQMTKRIWTVMAAGLARGFTFSALSLEDRIYRAERDGKGFIYKIYPGHFSFRRQYDDYDAEQYKSHKLALMAAAGMAVPTSYGVYDRAQDIPEGLPFPLVAKPDSGSLSRNVYPNVQTTAQLQRAAAIIEAAGERIKLESRVVGQDYRVLIIDHQYAGCVQRRPASVVGDGTHTILELFHQRNQEPGRGDRHDTHTTLHQLVFDDHSRQLLQRYGYQLGTVLPEGKRVYLQDKITAVTGADYIDCTEQLHPSIIESCVTFSYRFSTLTLGFDVITPDITQPLAASGGAFNEYNFLPYVDLHENCNEGQKRPVCDRIWDHIDAHAADIVTTAFAPF